MDEDPDTLKEALTVLLTEFDTLGDLEPFTEELTEIEAVGVFEGLGDPVVAGLIVGEPDRLFTEADTEEDPDSAEE